MPARKNKEIWKEIEKIIKEETEKNNINEKELLPGIYYLNGNDGTTFDIAANERLSEIGKIYKNEYFAVKLFLQKNGNLKIFSYPNLENLQEHIKRVIPSFVSDSYIHFAVYYLLPNPLVSTQFNIINVCFSRIIIKCIWICNTVLNFIYTNSFYKNFFIFINITFFNFTYYTFSFTDWN